MPDPAPSSSFEAVEDARLTHELEQLQAALGDMAPMLESFTRECEEAGYTRGEALELTKALLEAMYRAATDRDRGPFDGTEGAG